MMGSFKWGIHLMKKLFSFINKQKTLEDKYFSVVILVGVVLVISSAIITYAEKLSPEANIATLASGLMLAAVFFVAYRLDRMDLARLMLCYILNCFVIPLAFFFCGGIDSGMPLYMIAGVFLLIPVLKGYRRIICLIISFVVDIICIIVSYFYMPGAKVSSVPKKDILTHLTLEARFIDMICSLILIGMYLILTTALIMNAYQKEKEAREALLIKLDGLSKIDELTGLYNRREFFNYLEKTPLDDRFYMIMIDLDNFKDKNDTYGHAFGDDVLKVFADIMKKAIKDEDEIIARFGGEEFMMMIKADSKDTAFKRIDEARKAFEDKKWDVDVYLRITFSAGLIHLKEYDNITQALSAADRLLYLAKENGRNMIKTAD